MTPWRSGCGRVLGLGLLEQAGTPSAMASMPVRATAPDEKARSRSEQRHPAEDLLALGELVEGLLVGREGVEVAEVEVGPARR